MSSGLLESRVFKRDVVCVDVLGIEDIQLYPDITKQLRIYKIVSVILIIN